MNRSAQGVLVRSTQVNVLGPLSLSFAMNDGLDRLDVRAWQALVLSSLARHGEGLVVCNSEHRVVFSTSRGAHLLGALGASSDVLPDKLVVLVKQSTTTARLTPERGKHAIVVHFAELHHVNPPCTALWLSEEA